MNKPIFEGIKEVGRWGLLLAISWLVVQLLGQVNSIPETLNIKVWVFSLPIPVREVFVFTLTFVGRFADKWRFENTKVQPKVETKGILPF